MIANLKNLIWVQNIEDSNIEKEYTLKAIKEIGKVRINKLLNTAVRYLKNAYTPYSNYKVGASLLTFDNKIFGGCNSESVSYSQTVHAEGSAISKANTEGYSNKKRKFIQAVAVVHNGDSGPCGECLQRIVEHADNCLIIVAKPDGQIRRITSLKAIFPYNFNPSHLGK